MKTLLLVMLLTVGIQSWAFALESVPETFLQKDRFDDYYTVAEPSVPPNSEELNPVSVTAVLWDFVEDSYSWVPRIYSLMNFEHHNETFGNVLEPYNRQKHFGGWISDDPTPNRNCMNTRAQVLIRDSSVQVTLSRTGCTVATGKWLDPYGGREYRAASDIQIDHFVPLKNAYISGADKWTWKKRCLYSNFQGNSFHLLSVFGKENMKKSDRTPAEYMPPDRSYQCQYLSQWLKVKAIWNLGITPPEKEAIQSLVRQNHCNAGELSFSEKELSEQRRYIADNMNLCR